MNTPPKGVFYIASFTIISIGILCNILYFIYFSKNKKNLIFKDLLESIVLLILQVSCLLYIIFHK